jgi:hypothetical protein
MVREIGWSANRTRIRTPFRTLIRACRRPAPTSCPNLTLTPILSQLINYSDLVTSQANKSSGQSFRDSTHYHVDQNTSRGRPTSVIA